jgi:hypothetical protein
MTSTGEESGKGRRALESTRQQPPSTDAPPPISIGIATSTHNVEEQDAQGGRARDGQENRRSMRASGSHSPLRYDPSNAQASLSSALPRPNWLKRSESVWSQLRSGHLQNVMAGPARLNLINQQTYRRSSGNRRYVYILFCDT